MALVACSKGENRISKTNGYIYEPMDITNSENVQLIIQKYKPQTIIHTAAMTNVDACELDKESCFNINVNGTKNLLQAAKLIQQHKVHFIHLSTDFIFDGKNGPYKEEDEPNPLSRYAETKLESEKLVQQSSLKWSIVRTIIVFGVAEKMSRTNIVLWAIESLKNAKELTIVNDQFRSPTLAEDLAEACVKIADIKAQGIFHVSGKDFMSIYEMVVRIAKHLKLDTNLVIPISSSGLNQPAKRPPKTGFDIKKAIESLNYNPHSFEESIDIVIHQINK